MNFTEKDFKQYIQKLKIKDGDTIVIDPGIAHQGEEDKLMKYVVNLAKMYRDLDKIEVHFIILPVGGSMKKLNEAQMNKVGWYRKEGDDFSEPRGKK